MKPAPKPFRRRIKSPRNAALRMTGTRKRQWGYSIEGRELLSKNPGLLSAFRHILERRSPKKFKHPAIRINYLTEGKQPLPHEREPYFVITLPNGKLFVKVRSRAKEGTDFLDLKRHLEEFRKRKQMRRPSTQFKTSHAFSEAIQHMKKVRIRFDGRDIEFKIIPVKYHLFYESKNGRKKLIVSDYVGKDFRRQFDMIPYESGMVDTAINEVRKELNLQKIEFYDFASQNILVNLKTNTIAIIDLGGYERF